MTEISATAAVSTQYAFRSTGAAATGSANSPADMFTKSNAGQAGTYKPDFKLMASARPSEAEWPVPVANARGDYQVRTCFDNWVVTDPGGLNGRLSPEFPADRYDHIDVDWPSKPDVDNWPVTTSFPAGTELTPVMGNMGILYLNDRQGDPWMMVRRKDQPGSPISFVRSNMKYIQPEREYPIPTPDARGNYAQRTPHKDWVVTDPDPNGLRGRLSPEFPSETYDRMDAEWPTRPDIDHWPATTTFPSGTSLAPVMGNTGVIILRDRQGDPWMMVKNQNQQDGPHSFVRAHQDFIQPR